jgi:hypothetical protein
MLLRMAFAVVIVVALKLLRVISLLLVLREILLVIRALPNLPVLGLWLFEVPVVPLATSLSLVWFFKVLLVWIPLIVLTSLHVLLLILILILMLRLIRLILVLKIWWPSHTALVPAPIPLRLLPLEVIILVDLLLFLLFLDIFISLLHLLQPLFNLRKFFR